MKNLLFIVLFIPLVSLSQVGFEYILEDTIDSKCYSSFMDDQGYIVSLGTIYNPTSDLYDALILKYQDSSDVLEKKFNPGGMNCGFWFGSQKENGNYFLIGLTWEPYFSLYFAEVDQELELVQETYYQVQFDYHWINVQESFEDENNTIILTGALYNEIYQQLGMFVTRVNKNGEVLKTTIITDLYCNSGIEFIKKLDGSGYYLIGTSQEDIIIFDNDLDVVDYQFYPVGSVFNTPLALRWLPDGNIMVANMINQGVPGAYYDIRLRIVDEGFNTIKDTTFFDEGKNWPADLSSLDYIDPDNIWVVSQEKSWKSSKDEWEHARVYIVDSELNVKGAKYFAGELEVYLFSTKVLEDGSCIITGMVPKAGKPTDYNAYIRKIMLDDVLTAAEETVAEDDSDVLLYPVPFEKRLNIETYRKNLSLSIFNENGICIIEKQALQIPYTY
ncbi:MAG: hypothetical protein R2764_16045 [Bacteroidales bacterium]